MNNLDNTPSTVENNPNPSSNTSGGSAEIQPFVDIPLPPADRTTMTIIKGDLAFTQNNVPKTDDSE